jgi:hypothetical protein
MRKIVAGFGLSAIAVVVGISYFGSMRPAVGSDKPTAGEEHDFGDKVLIVTLRPVEKLEMGSLFIEKASVRRLGDRYFVVGQVPDLGEQLKATKGVVVWLPVSEITQLSEYDSVQAALKSAEAARPPKPKR